MVDFGNPSNAFLRACGVKEEPTPLELTQQVIRSPNSFLDQMGFQKYLQILRTIAANYFMLKQTALLNEMKQSPFLIGVRTESGSLNSASTEAKITTPDHEENEKVHYELARAREICLIDDTVLGQLFSPLG